MIPSRLIILLDELAGDEGRLLTPGPYRIAAGGTQTAGATTGTVVSPR